MVYTAKNPLVLGVGFAAFRDLGSFLRYEKAAPGGGSNPIFGTVNTTYTVGASQSGAFIHGFIFYRFNKDETGRIVFDGAWPQIDARMMVMNIRWGQPNNLMYLYMGGDETPVWWADYPNLARSLPPNGMLHRCAESSTCPQILETFALAELYSEKMSVGLCGFTFIGDIQLPSNVHRYYTPGATHGGGNGSVTWTARIWLLYRPASRFRITPFRRHLPIMRYSMLSSNCSCRVRGCRQASIPRSRAENLVPNTAAAEGFLNKHGAGDYDLPLQYERGLYIVSILRYREHVQKAPPTTL
jgi:hypothetical protein